MDVEEGPSMQFLGYDVVFSQVMPTAANVGVSTVGVLFGDLELAAKMGDRRQRAIQSGFENDDFTRQLMTILATQRVDINVHTIVDPKNPTQPGPILGLKTAAS